MDQSMEIPVPDAVEDRLSELLLAWEEAAERGVSISPATLCRDCPELIPAVEREIHRLRQFDQFLPSLEVKLGEQDDSSDSPGQPHANSLPGYVLLEELGRGGMGVVFKARQISLGRLVAVKMLVGAHWHAPASVARLRQEARLLSRLNHPQVVQVIDVIDQRHQVSLILEYVEGESLAQRLLRSTLPGQEAARIALSLADALQAVHVQGLMHRDLKPGNVLLGKAGEVKVADFGIAKDLEDHDGLTMTGELLGSPGYFAPEQVDRRLERVGVTVDVYGLGATLYSMLVGRPPFSGGSVAETIDCVRHQDPVPPRLLISSIPADLETICLKCLDKEPARRYASAEDLAADLRRFINHEPIKARRSGFVRYATRWCRRQPLMASLILLTLAVVTGAISLAAVRHRELSEHSVSLEKLNDDLQQAASAARKHQEIAERRELEAREGLFAAQMTEAAQAGRERDFFAQRELLDKWLPGPGQFDYRGFAWWYLNGQTPQVAQDLYSAGSGIYLLVDSPGHKLIAAGGQAPTVWVLDASTGAVQRTIDTGQVEVNGLAFSPDLRQLATAGDDGSVCIWNLSDGTRQTRIAAHPGKAYQVIWRREDQRLYTCGDDQKIRVFDPQSGKALGSLDSHTDEVQALVDGGDGRTLVSAGSDRNCFVWDVASRKPIETFVSSRRMVNVGITTDRSWLVTGGELGQVEIFALASGDWHETVNQYDRIRSVAAHPDGIYLAAGDDGGVIRLWKVDPQKNPRVSLVTAWHAHRGGVFTLLWSKDRQELLSSGADGMIRRWKMEQIVHRDFRRHQVGVCRDVAVLGDTQMVLALTTGLEIRNWESNQLIQQISNRRYKRVAVTPDHQRIIAVTDANSLLVFGKDESTRHFEQRSEWPPHGEISLLTTSPDSRRVAIALWTADGPQHKPEHSIWTFPLPSLERPERAKLPWSNVAAFLPDSRRIALRTSTGIALCDERYRILWEQPQSDLNWLTPSADGKLLFSRVNGRGVMARSTDTGAIKFTLVPHTFPVNGLVISPDQRTLASSDESGSIRLAHIPTGRSLFELATLEPNTRVIGFSPSGRELICFTSPSSDKGESFVWVIETSTVRTEPNQRP